MDDEKKKRILALIKKISLKRAKKEAKKRPQPEPRYDDIYFDGLKWLDSL